MRVAFRTDATSRIGAGHFMRCLTLATALRREGAYVRFVSRDLPLHLRELLIASSMDLASLDAGDGESAAGDLAHASWLGASQMQDAQATVAALADTNWDWIVVDHYALDARWEALLRDSGGRIMAIDDIADRRHDCDVLLDQNVYKDMRTRYAGKVPVRCRLLLGPDYALLRDEFRRARTRVSPRVGSVKRVLVFFGGVDAENYTGRAIEVLSGSEFADLSVDVVIGAQHPYRERTALACVPRGFHCHVQTTRMAELMAAADLAIGAAGSASWERCCLGLPAVLVASADNQIGIARGLALSGACVYIEVHGAEIAPRLRDALESLLRDPDRVRMLSEKAFALVDGEGVERVCSEMRH
jgi:UDP-2,4-diacetamido-2,4,6-trideoxy-beta-L-altropyranose hydrolase